MAKKIDVRVKKKDAFVKALPRKAKKKRVVKAKNPPKKKRKDKLHFDAFAEACLDTAVWADKPEDCDADDVWPACIPQILEDCYRFQRENKDLLDAAYQLMRQDGGDRRLYDMTDAGHDFWLSRNGHGTGFWDRGLGEVGDKLAKAASAYGNVDVLPGEGKQSTGSLSSRSQSEHLSIHARIKKCQMIPSFRAHFWAELTRSRAAIRTTRVGTGRSIPSGTQDRSLRSSRALQRSQPALALAGGRSVRAAGRWRSPIADLWNAILRPTVVRAFADGVGLKD